MATVLQTAVGTSQLFRPHVFASSKATKRLEAASRIWEAASRDPFGGKDPLAAYIPTSGLAMEKEVGRARYLLSWRIDSTVPRTHHSDKPARLCPLICWCFRVDMVLSVRVS